MQERWAVKSQFALYNKGVPRHFHPDYIHRDGLPGYPELPKWVTKKQRKKLFYQITVPGDSEPVVVEAATAAPGETRTVTKPAAKKPTVKKKVTK